MSGAPQQELRGDAAIQHHGIGRAERSHDRGHLRGGGAHGEATDRFTHHVEPGHHQDELAVTSLPERQSGVMMSEADGRSRPAKRWRDRAVASPRFRCRSVILFPSLSQIAPRSSLTL